MVGAVLGGWYCWSLIRPSVINPNVELNPEKEYSVTLWAERLPVSWDGQDYEDRLKAAIKEFQGVYPNITVRLRIFPRGEGLEAVSKALAHGLPPDLYGAESGPALFETPLQVRAGIYTSNEKEYYRAVPINLCGKEDFYCWPRWVMPQVMLGNTKLLERAGVDVSRIQEKGWTWDQFIEAARKVKRSIGPKVVPVLFQPRDEQAFVSLLRTLDSGNAVIRLKNDRSREGSEERPPVAWRKEDIQRVISFLNTLWQERLIPVHPWEKRHEFLAGLVRGQTVLIGPVGTWAVRLDRFGVELSILPIPRAEHEAHDVQVAGWAMFRQPGRIDNQRLKAAALLADYLTRHFDPVVAAKLSAFPAVQDGEDGGVGSGQAKGDTLITRILAGKASCRLESVTQWKRRQRFIEQVVRPAMVSFWQDPGQGAAVVTEITEGIVSFRDSATDNRQIDNFNAR